MMIEQFTKRLDVNDFEQCCKNSRNSNTDFDWFLPGNYVSKITLSLVRKNDNVKNSVIVARLTVYKIVQL